MLQIVIQIIYEFLMASVTLRKRTCSPKMSKKCRLKVGWPRVQFYFIILFQARERAARGEPEPVKKTPGTARRGRPPKTKPAGEGAPDTATDDSQVRKTKPPGGDAPYTVTMTHTGMFTGMTHTGMRMFNKTSGRGRS